MKTIIHPTGLKIIAAIQERRACGLPPPSWSLLCALTGRSLNAITRQVVRLERLGILSCERRGGHVRARTLTLNYRLEPQGGA